LGALFHRHRIVSPELKGVPRRKGRWPMSVKTPAARVPLVVCLLCALFFPSCRKEGRGAVIKRLRRCLEQAESATVHAHTEGIYGLELGRSELSPLVLWMREATVDKDPPKWVGAADIGVRCADGDLVVIILSFSNRFHIRRYATGHRDNSGGLDCTYMMAATSCQELLRELTKASRLNGGRPGSAKAH